MHTSRPICAYIYIYTHTYTHVHKNIPHILIPIAPHFQCSKFPPVDLSNLLVSLPFSLKDFLKAFVFANLYTEEYRERKIAQEMEKMKT